jgi:hypothetical protein
MIKKTPELKSLPIIPLPDQCNECKFYNICDYTEILRTADDDIDGISFTYDKGTALLAGNNSVNKEILNKIFSTVKNVVLDECHWLETEKTVSIPIPVDDDFSASIFKKYEKIIKSIAILNMICKFMDIVDDELVKKAIREVYEQIQHKTAYEASLKRVIHRDNGTKFDRIKMCNEVYGEIVNLVESSQFKKLKLDDIKQLYNMLAIVMAPRIQVHAIRDEGRIEVQITAVDSTPRLVYAEFIKSMQHGKRIILTSGTINNNFDYNSLFLSKVNHVLWGKNGDPMNTNATMHIFADHRKLDIVSGRSKYSLHDNFSLVIDDILKIMNIYPRVKIVAINSHVAGMIQYELEHRIERTRLCEHMTDDEQKRYPETVNSYTVDYYKSKTSMGVSSDCRVMITVGIAYKPSWAYDAVTENEEESYIKMRETTHADTWQMLTRVKDPEGEVDSLVFMIGSNLKESEQVSAWGINRIVMAEQTGSGRKKCDVLIRSEQIAKPTIEKCDDVDEMLNKADRYRYTILSFIEQDQWAVSEGNPSDNCSC